MTMFRTPSRRRLTPRQRRLLTTGALVLAVAAGAAVYADRHRGDAPQISVGPSTDDDAVRRAAHDAGCSYLTERGEPGGAHQVVLVSRTGLMAGAGLPGALVGALAAVAGGGSEPVGSLTLVTVGGDGEVPVVVLDGAALADASAGARRRQRLVKSLDTCLDAVLAAAPGPRKPGSDELRGLQEAGRRAAAARASDQRVGLAVVSDGEANTGLLDLRPGFLTRPPAEVVAEVAAGGELPDLAGAEVTFYGVGQARSEAERRWLEEVDHELCARGGAASCTILADRVPLGEEPVSVPADPPLVAVRQLTETGFRVDAAAFRPFTAELVEPARVRADLAAVRAAVLRDDVRLVRVEGHACDDGSPTDRLVRLSRERADVVADLLGRLLPESVQVQADGVGAARPAAGPEADGRFNAAQCAVNRRVEITLGRP